MNKFKIFFLTILSLSINLIKPLPRPVPLTNSASYNGGICFANSTLQCLLQIPKFVDSADSGRSEQLKLFVDQIKQDRPSNAWPLVQNIYTEGEPYIFMQKLVENIGYTNMEFRYYREKNDIFRFQRENETSGRINFYEPIAATKNQFSSDLMLNVVPELQTLIIRPQARTTEEFNKKDLSKLLEDETNGLGQVWLSIQSEIRASSKFEVKGIVVMINTGRTGHAMSYVKNNKVWFKCNDSRIREIGGIEEVKNEIYQKKETPTIIIFEQNYIEEPFMADTELEEVIRISREEFEINIPRDTPIDEDLEMAIRMSLEETRNKRRPTNFYELEISTIDDISKIIPLIREESILDELFEILLTDPSLTYEGTILNEKGLNKIQYWLLNNKK
jgi:hypothetical protein